MQELDFPEGQARFDSYVQPHVNLICTRCGKIQDCDDPAARETIMRIAAKAEFTRTGQRLDIYGICKTCQGNQKTSTTGLKLSGVRLNRKHLSRK